MGDLIEKVKLAIRNAPSSFTDTRECNQARSAIAIVREHDGFQPMNSAPYDEYVLLKVNSGMRSTPFDYVYAMRHSDGYKNSAWLNVQNDHITERHVGEIYGWRRMEEVGDE